MFSNLFEGNSVSDPGTTGNRAAITNLIAAVLSVLLGVAGIFIPTIKTTLSQDDVLLIASALGTVASAFNAYFHVATNVDSGIKSE